MGIDPKLRILIAKPGLDGHDRGAKIVARALKDAGMEVVYTGLHQSPAQIVRTAIDEDVAAIGISILSGAHNTFFPKLMDLLQAEGAADIRVFAGGTIPPADFDGLHSIGVERIFTPGASTDDIVAYVRQVLGVSPVSPS